VSDKKGFSQKKSFENPEYSRILSDLTLFIFRRCSPQLRKLFELVENSESMPGAVPHS